MRRLIILVVMFAVSCSGFQVANEKEKDLVIVKKVNYNKKKLFDKIKLWAILNNENFKTDKDLGILYYKDSIKTNIFACKTLKFKAVLKAYNNKYQIKIIPLGAKGVWGHDVQVAKIMLKDYQKELSKISNQIDKRLMK